MIEQAFHAYTKAVEAMFELSRRPPTTKESKVEWLDKEAQLRHRVDQLEERPEFRALTRETLSAFRSYDWHSAKRESWRRDPVRQFFRRTGYYTDTFAGSDKPCDLFERYEAAFQRRSVQTKYLAPLEFVRFPKQEFKFSVWIQHSVRHSCGRQRLGKTAKCAGLLKTDYYSLGERGRV